MDEKTEEGFLRLSFDEIDVARHLFGPREENIKYLKKYFNIKASIRGTHLTLLGAKKDIEDAGKVISELQGMVKKGFTIHHADIDHAVHFLAHSSASVGRTGERRDIYSRIEEDYHIEDAEPETLYRCHTKT